MEENTTRFILCLWFQQPSLLPQKCLFKSPLLQVAGWDHLFPAFLRTVGSMTNLCSQRMFEKYSLKGQGCPNRVVSQSLLGFYMPNKPEKANKHFQCDPRRIDEAVRRRWDVTLPVELGKNKKQLLQRKSLTLLSFPWVKWFMGEHLFIISNCRHKQWKWRPYLPAAPSLPGYL